MKTAFRGLAAAALAFLAAGTARAAPRLITGDGLEPLPLDTRPVHYFISTRPDLAAARFEATAELTFEVVEPTAVVTVNSLGLDIASARLAGGGPVGIRKDEARQRVSFEVGKPLPKGTHKISVVYSGPIYDESTGLFKVDYPTQSGETKRMLFAMMCCIGAARRFAPMWDQPDLKAVFEIEMVVPEALDAYSNMPVVRREDLAGGLQRVRFAPTPKMSTYLLFLSAGEFDRIKRSVGSTELGVVLQRGKGKLGHFALGATADSITAYNDYFATPYPLPKLDSLGMPGVGNFGAMENWGAIFYFEPYISVDPAISTEKDRQGVYEIVAHEVAHQWFGNLVTMDWWDDLWLNEGFASWMAVKTSDRFHPEWKMWLHAADDRETAIRLDASATTHPIIRAVKTLEEAELAFDAITYEKGSQVIRMLEGWVGEDAFRTAIRAHMRNHAYGNAVTADLLKEIDRASEFPVTAIARDYTEQSGVPLIEVLSTQCAQGSKTTVVSLRQGRFGLDEPSRAPRTWHVPVTAAVAGSDQVARRIVRGPEPVRLEVPGCGPVKINVGETGYFRTQYDAASLAALEKSFGSLSTADQLGLLKDGRGLAEGGYGSFETYLDIADALPASADPLLKLDYIGTVRDLDRLYIGLPAQRAFRAFARARFAGMLAEVGWVARPGEPANTASLRNELIELLGKLGDEATVVEARRRFQGAEKDPSLLPGAVRKAVVSVVGSAADAATFDDFTARAARARDSAERTMYLLSIAGAADPAIATRVLEFTLTEAVPPQAVGRLLQAVADRHPERAFDFAAARYDSVAPRVGESAPMLVAGLGGHALDASFLQRFSAFTQQRLAGKADESAERAMAAVRYRDQLRRRSLPQVDRWLSRQAAR
jgi:aminopeptidase N